MTQPTLSGGQGEQARVGPSCQGLSHEAMDKSFHRDSDDRRPLGRSRVCETHADERPEELEGPPAPPIGTKDLLSQPIKQRRAV